MKEKTATAHVRVAGACIQFSIRWLDDELSIKRATGSLAEKIAVHAIDNLSAMSCIACAAIDWAPQFRCVCVVVSAIATFADGSEQQFDDVAPVMVDGETFEKWGKAIMTIKTKVKRQS